MNNTCTVARIDDQGDRVLLYPDATTLPMGLLDEYYIIAPAGTKLAAGDQIEYEPYGFNFGWFVKKMGAGT